MQNFKRQMKPAPQMKTQVPRLPISGPATQRKSAPSSQSRPPGHWSVLPSLRRVTRFTRMRQHQAQTFVARVASSFPLYPRRPIYCVGASTFDWAPRPAGRGGLARVRGRGYAVRFALNEIDLVPREDHIPG
ncbi:hypothetical protein EDB86DRAFT_3249432 [Lactarius hatsudake]|nr:hypothetical protein EDB86DRAFT_3249432 [Lactarius hatsudake]